MHSWAILTGATDGIGKAFCQELAKEGFNIILVSRNSNKLTQVALELKQIYKIKTHTIQYDFAVKTSIENYLETFSKLPDEYDLSILVNNVGVNEKGYANNISLESFFKMINVNVFPQVLLTKIFYYSLLKREYRSAIIDLSSVSSIRPFPIRSIYSATKSFNKFISVACANEFKQYNIDFLCVKPFYVETPLTQKKANGFTTIKANECVIATLNDLGYEKETFGDWRHKIIAYFLDYIPLYITNNFFSR